MKTTNYKNIVYKYGALAPISNALLVEEQNKLRVNDSNYLGGPQIRNIIYI